MDSLNNEGVWYDGNENVASFFLLEGFGGVIPGNVSPELVEALVGREVFRARGVCAGGTMEGLRYYGVLA